jgi:hypothetical protein
MPNLVEVNYGRTGKSTNWECGRCRREYLLVKAPPASGKSRALIISGKIIDYIYNKGLKRTSGK